MPRNLATDVRLALGVALMLITCSLSAWAEEFSADIVTTGAPAASAPRVGKIYVQNDEIHIAIPDLPAGFFLLDAARPSAYFVEPAGKLFMDAKQTSPLTQILVPLDPNDPCPRWRTMAVAAGATDANGSWTCQSIGKDSLDGRNVLLYRTFTSWRRTNLIWIDPQLKFPLRIRSDDGTTVDLKNLREGPQEASLFALPATYRKFDPQVLINRIKQSDVWVEPPK
jgi:hypothetical protein